MILEPVTSVMSERFPSLVEVVARGERKEGESSSVRPGDRTRGLEDASDIRVVQSFLLPQSERQSRAPEKCRREDRGHRRGQWRSWDVLCGETKLCWTVSLIIHFSIIGII